MKNGDSKGSIFSLSGESGEFDFGISLTWSNKDGKTTYGGSLSFGVPFGQIKVTTEDNAASTNIFIGVQEDMKQTYQKKNMGIQITEEAKFGYEITIDNIEN